MTNDIKSGKLLSVVIPVYGAPEIVPLLYRRLTEALDSWTDFELVMVDDACPAGSGLELAKLAETDSRVKVVTLSTNRGQHIAISAGLDYAAGDYVAVMDCDLQDPPEELETLYNHLAEGGYDAVFGVRANRQDNWFKRFRANCYHALFYRIAQQPVKTKRDHANFSIITRQLAEHFRLFRERNRSYSELIKHLTCNIGFLDVRHAARHSGRSSYSLRKYVNVGVAYILGNSNRPLIISIYCAFIAFFIALVLGLRVAFNYFAHGTTVPGWTSLAMIVCFFSGLQMLFLGIVGLYIGAIFNESKKRPLYLVSKTQNLADEGEKKPD